MKKSLSILLTILMIVSTCLISGCDYEDNPEDVSLTMRHSMDDYVRKNYGPAECLSETKEDNNITYNYRDKEYGFEYYIKSYVQRNEFDGCLLGYSEEKSTDFYKVYGDYIRNSIEKKMKDYEDEYNIQIQFLNYASSREFSPLGIYVTNDLETILNKVGEDISRIDNRGYFRYFDVYKLGEDITNGDVSFRIFGEGEFVSFDSVGKYSLEEDKFISSAEQE